MVRRVDADKNMGELLLTVEQARDVIERARAGLPVAHIDLQRACMVAYKGKEPRKLVLPILTRLQRADMNTALMNNLWSHRYHTLQEKHNAATAGQDEPAAVCQADPTPS